MTNIFAFTVEGPPVPKERPRMARNGKVFTPKKTLDYEALVHGICVLKRPPTWKLSGTFKLGFKIYRVRNAGDLDNFIKSIKDGLAGAAFFNDRQVKGYIGDPEMFVDRVRPRAEITIRRVLA